MIVPRPLDALDANAVLALSGGLLAAAIVALTLRVRGKSAANAANTKEGVKLRKIHSLPGNLPLLGDLLEYSANAETIYDWTLRYCLHFRNEPWKFVIPGVSTTVIMSTPSAVDDVLNKQFDKFQRGDYQKEVFEAVLGKGLLSSDGERWYHQRKTAAKFFSAKTLRAFMVQSMRKNVHQLYTVLDRAMARGDQVELGVLFHEFTTQVFMEMGLGVDADLIGNPNPHPFSESLDRTSPITMRRTRMPGFLWRLERWLGVGKERELADAMKIVHDWINPVIAKSLESSLARLNQPAGSSRSSNGDKCETKSVMDLFVEHSREDAVGIRAEDIVDFILTFVLGARDTTALALSWFFYALHDHPHIEKKIREEMASCIPDLYRNKSEYLTIDDLKPLTYLEATIKESLRLYTVGPYVMREAMEDTVIDGDIFIPKGYWIGLSPYAMARSPLIWGEDAAQFKPERWIDPKTNQILVVPSTKFFTFGTGPRICIGMNLAMLELRVLIANLLSRYHFEVDPTNDGSYVVGITLMMKHPLHVKLHPSASAAA